MDRTTERKRNYLERYRRMIDRIGEIDAEIDRLYGIKSPELSDMPKGSGKSTDLSVMASLIEEYRAEQNGLRAECNNILDAINALTDIQEQRVLYMRYVLGKSLREIYDRQGVLTMNYEQIRYIHTRGLQDIVVFPINPCYDIY